MIQKGTQKRKIRIISIMITALVFIGITSYTVEAGRKEAKQKKSAQVQQEQPATTVTRGPGYHVNRDFDLIPNDAKTPANVVLITIDDGPTKYAEDMRATLAKHNIKAIFFINGTHDKIAPGVIEADFKAGHTIGNHTWSHPTLSKIKNEKIDTEISTNSVLIKKITGSDPRFFRAPFGVSTPYAKETVKKAGMIFMNWSGAAVDWDKKAYDKKVFVNNVMKNIHNGEIILLHEHPWSRDALDELLTQIEAKGYTFASPEQITD